MSIVHGTFKKRHLKITAAHIIISKAIEKDWDYRPRNLLDLWYSLHKLDRTHIKDCSERWISFDVLVIEVVVYVMLAIISVLPRNLRETTDESQS